mmetsp:Transcript_36995/g.52267  ORF Transcript_36995/g.52267 Transcript_36995/m.52267 type:complete len:1117 (-) Transcript_36995:618-3968(-)
MSVNGDSNTNGGMNKAGMGQANKKKNLNKKSGRQNQAALRGRIEELRNNVYDYTSNRHDDMFTTTTKEIANYVGRTFTLGGYMKSAIESLSTPTLTLPEEPGPNPTMTERRIWDEKIKLHVKREMVLEEGIQKLYSVVWGQCTDAMQARLEGIREHGAIAATLDGIGLLKEIKSVAFQFENQKYQPVSVHMAVRRFYLMSQGNSNNHDYLEKFNNNVELIEVNGGELGTANVLVESELTKLGLNTTTATVEQRKEAKKAARQAYLSTAFMLGSDRNRYGLLLQDLENNYVQGTNKYPTTIVQAYDTLNLWRNNPTYLMKSLGGFAEGMVFTQERKKGTIVCYRCGRAGHIAPKCSHDTHQDGHSLATNGAALTQEATGEDVTETESPGDGDHNDTTDVEVEAVMTNANDEANWDWHNEYGFYQAGTTLTEGSSFEIPENWVLLDSQSTVDVIKSRHMLTHIRRVKVPLKLHCNGGHAITHLKGHLAGYGWVWYMPNAIANILSLAHVKRKYKVQYDSSNNDGFTVTSKDGKITKFKEHKSGLFYHDTSAYETGFVMMVTVKGKQSQYVKRDVDRAVFARRLQNIIGRPAIGTYLDIVENNRLKDCPVTRGDVLAAEDMFGPNVGSLKGKTVRCSGKEVRGKYMDVPRSIMEQYKDVTLCVDIMFVNAIPFLVTIGRNVPFRTITVLRSRQISTIVKHIIRVRSAYIKRGFRINAVHADYEFEPGRARLMDAHVHLNIAAQGEHVPEIERSIRMIKERARATWNVKPFRTVPLIMLVELLYGVTFWLNCFPPSTGALNGMSPRAVMTGLVITMEHCKLEWGDYVQSHEDTDNTLAPRTLGAIALRPTGNEQGGQYFLNLSTGRRIIRHAWTWLPMPTHVIARVNELGSEAFSRQDLLFQFSNGEHVDDSDDDSSYGSNSDNESVSGDISLDLNMEADPVSTDDSEEENIHQPQEWTILSMQMMPPQWITIPTTKRMMKMTMRHIIAKTASQMTIPPLRMTMFRTTMMIHTVTSTATILMTPTLFMSTVLIQMIPLLHPRHQAQEWNPPQTATRQATKPICTSDMDNAMISSTIFAHARSQGMSWHRKMSSSAKPHHKMQASGRSSNPEPSNEPTLIG